MDDQAIQERRHAIEKAGLEISCFTPEHFFPAPHINLASPWPNIRKDSIEYIKASIDCAAKLGAPIVNVCPGRCYFHQPRKDAWQLLVQAIGECADYARPLGVKITVEPLPPIESNLIVTLQDYVELASQVRAQNLGCLLDIGHLNVIHESGLDFVSVLRDELLHVHLSDNNGIYDQGLVPGEGNVQFEPFIKALIDNGYKGYLSFELSFSYLQNPDAAAYRARMFIEKLLRKL
jgi:protein FrlC